MDLSNSNLVVQMIVGVVFLAGGVTIAEKVKSLPIKILGLVLAVGGTAVLLEPIPRGFFNSSTASNLKFFVVTAVFVACGVLVARTSDGSGAKLIGVLLAFFGALALFVQLGSLMYIPGGMFGDVIQAALDSISRIFAQANTQLN